MTNVKQVIVTVASGPPAERLDRTFLSFAQNPFAELHAFIIGDQLPARRLPQVTYHLKAPDPSFSDPMRDLYYRRWLFIDELDAEYALVVDNGDVLCLQPLPQIPELLRGASIAACAEHDGGRYILGQGYTSSYLNCGVTFWHLPSSREIRKEIVDRGRRYFRSVDDQLTANEVIHTRYFRQLTILPSQYNFRAFLAPVRIPFWPTVDNLDGVVIYHNSRCIDIALKLLPAKSKATLHEFPEDKTPLTRFQQFKRKARDRMKSRIPGAGLIRRLFH